MPSYTHGEFYEMVRCYILSGESLNGAKRLYEEQSIRRLRNRGIRNPPIPHNATILSANQRLLDYGQFVVPTHAQGRGRPQLAVDNPRSSTRYAARRFRKHNQLEADVTASSSKTPVVPCSTQTTEEDHATSTGPPASPASSSSGSEYEIAIKEELPPGHDPLDDPDYPTTEAGCSNAEPPAKKRALEPLVNIHEKTTENIIKVEIKEEIDDSSEYGCNFPEKNQTQVADACTSPLPESQIELFGKHIIDQLKQLSQHQYLIAQEEIQRILTRCREFDILSEQTAIISQTF